jgi:transaldolase
MNRIEKLHALGQSIWYDNIQRKLLENGELEALIRRGDIRGVTSNPSIFNNAIAKTNDYDAALKPMARAGWDAEEIFFQLAVEDIRAAADLFRPLYDETKGGDGYVSLEVSPTRAHDAEGTAAEARRLWDWVNRPNLMVKIPATLEGLPAIRKTIAAGVNVNVTLIFSLARYAAVIDAYLSGLEDRVSAGLPIGTIASVASFFISRADSKVDARLETIIKKEGPEAEQAAGLLGKAAIANAKMAYEIFLSSVASDRFKALRQHGARLQRPLWASTSTKNPAYRDVVYIEDLIGENTINTVPPQTLEAFRDHGEASLTLAVGMAEAHQAIAAVEALGISMDQVTAELEDEGVTSFSDAFAGMLKTIDARRQAALVE